MRRRRGGGRCRLKAIRGIIKCFVMRWPTRSRCRILIITSRSRRFWQLVAICKRTVGRVMKMMRLIRLRRGMMRRQLRGERISKLRIKESMQIEVRVFN